MREVAAASRVVLCLLVVLICQSLTLLLCLATDRPNRLPLPAIFFVCDVLLEPPTAAFKDRHSAACFAPKRGQAHATSEQSALSTSASRLWAAGSSLIRLDEETRHQFECLPSPTATDGRKAVQLPRYGELNDITARQRIAARTLSCCSQFVLMIERTRRITVPFQEDDRDPLIT